MTTRDSIVKYENLVDRDPLAAEKELSKLAAAGDADAMYVLGIAYYDADIPGKDVLEAVSYLEQAMELGHIEATHHLGCLRYYGYGLPEGFVDHETAASFLNKSAKQGFTPSITFLASMYENGEGVAKDVGRAKQLLEMAADEGDEVAIRRLRENKQS